MERVLLCEKRARRETEEGMVERAGDQKLGEVGLDMGELKMDSDAVKPAERGG